MIGRSSTARPRPSRYTPTQVERVSAYLLAKQMSFESSSTGIFPVGWLRFQQPDDGMTINYFTTVKDIEGNHYPYPTAKEWLTSYLSQIKQGIGVNDISVLPLVLVKNNRRHFNTLLLTSNETANELQLTMYVIEPKSHNEYNKFKIFPGLYPIENMINSLFDAVKSSDLPVSIDIHHLRLGVQGMFNDKDCGAHHINVVETISGLTPATLQNPTQLLSSLRAINVSNRNNDGMILNHLNECEDLTSICIKNSGISSRSSLST